MYLWQKAAVLQQPYFSLSSFFIAAVKMLLEPIRGHKNHQKKNKKKAPIAWRLSSMKLCNELLMQQF
jgi:hypothetical protein